MDEYKKEILGTYKYVTEDVIWELFEDGQYQVESLVEKAIEIVGEKTRNSINGMDFTDKSDAKKCTLCHEKGGYERYWYAIKNVSSKVGRLRIMGWNWKLNKFDYFIIPKKIYKDVNILKISVDKNTFIPIGKYAKWQVNSFDSMAYL
jgi:hypothetical protein